MAKGGRLVAVILEVSDLDRSEALYRDGFGLDLHPGDNRIEDRWIGGRHAEISWLEGPTFILPFIQRRRSRPLVHRSHCLSLTSTMLMRQQYVRALASFTNHVRNLGGVVDDMRTLTEM